MLDNRRGIFVLNSPCNASFRESSSLGELYVFFPRDGDTYLIFRLGEGDTNFLDGETPPVFIHIGGLVLSVTFKERRVVRSERGVCGGKEGGSSRLGEFGESATTIVSHLLQSVAPAFKEERRLARSERGVCGGNVGECSLFGEFGSSEIAIASLARLLDRLLDMVPLLFLLPLLLLDLTDFFPDVALLASFEQSSIVFFSYLIFLPAKEGRLGAFESFSSLLTSLLFANVGARGSPDGAVLPSLLGRFRDDDRRRDGDGCDNAFRGVVDKGDAHRR